MTDGDDILIFSRSDATRPVNLSGNPRVAYNLRGDFQGDHVVTMEGIATVEPDAPGPLGNARYISKYKSEILRLGWTPEQFDRDFPVSVRIAVTRIRAV